MLTRIMFCRSVLQSRRLDTSRRAEVRASNSAHFPCAQLPKFPAWCSFACRGESLHHSIRLDPRRFHQVSPLRLLAADEIRQFIAGLDIEIDTGEGNMVGQVLAGQDFFEFCLQSRD